MRRALLAILVVVFVLGLTTVALAGPTPSAPGIQGPTTINPGSNVYPTNIDPATGAALFTYKDLQDGTAKPEGGYAAFSGPVTATYYNAGTPLGTAGTVTNQGYATSPHGGYSASSNKCAVCHAVHRAEGAYYLLRADSQSDACDYCHIGGSAHSDQIVYDLNPAGTATTNGHTMGAGQVPDSSLSQTATPVSISGTDFEGNPVTETLNVRSYDPTGITMYRFSRHHSQSPVGTGRSGWKPVGPTSLSCFSCHQPHNAAAQVWQPSKFDPTLVKDIPGGNPNGYKLLRRYPSGSWIASAATQTVNVTNVITSTTATATVNGAGPDGVNSFGFVDNTRAVKVPETTLTAGVNFSTTHSNANFYAENGVTGPSPTWISQGWEAEVAGPSGDPKTVNQYTLSVWCADCHNLNIGGQYELNNEELGLKAHQERTHEAPFTGAHGGPSQCYACHRNDLSVSMGVADPAANGAVRYGQGQVKESAIAADACTQCHYGTQAYYADQTLSGRNSDFPHSGKATDIKLLGSYTASTATSLSYTPVFTSTQITETNLDAVCIRCHPGIGVHN